MKIKKRNIEIQIEIVLKYKTNIFSDVNLMVIFHPIIASF